MNEPSAGIRDVVTVLLVLAAVVVIWLMVSYTDLGAILLTILLAICGGLAVRYPPYQ